MSSNVTFTQLMPVRPSTLAHRVFAETQLGHNKVLFRTAARSLMTRAMSSSNEIIIAICSADALAASS